MAIQSKAKTIASSPLMRKRAEEALIESEERFRFMAETLPLKIFTADAEGRITYFNPQWAEYIGLPVEKLIEERVLKFLHPDDVDENMRGWRQALVDGKPLQNEQRLLRHDGQYRRHISYARAMRNDAGKIIGWFGSMTDIEDVIQAEVQKEKLELMAEGLKQQRAQLLAINNTKDEFIALSSHQLRTPATAVKQYISLVLSEYFGPLSAEQTQNLQTAYDSNERQLNIINDLLKTAQIDSRQYMLNKEDAVIADILSESMADLKSALQIKDQKILFNGKQNRTKIKVDSRELKLAFVNLLENAIKYSYPGGTITVQLQKNTKSLQIEISDQGVGIASKDTKRIFDKFTRVSNELSDTVNGSGLGLYWVKKIIKLHQGAISVRSAMGKGSTFIVKLPL
jgi:PAS domain S-box-containing protein